MLPIFINWITAHFHSRKDPVGLPCTSISFSGLEPLAESETARRRTTARRRDDETASPAVERCLIFSEIIFVPGHSNIAAPSTGPRYGTTSALGYAHTRHRTSPFLSDGAMQLLVLRSPQVVMRGLPDAAHLVQAASQRIELTAETGGGLAQARRFIGRRVAVVPGGMKLRLAEPANSTST